MTDFQYSVQLRWSEQDGHYLAQIEELPGCLADGETAEEAFANLMQIAHEWIEVAKEEDRDIPKPVSIEAFFREFQKRAQANAEATTKQISQVVAAAAQKAVSKAWAELQQQQRQKSAEVARMSTRGGILTGDKAAFISFMSGDVHWMQEEKAR